ncbi:MAG: glucose-6-phosphate isomerase [Chlamydiae bacterium]|nr:MAG: glucose-6-phosphate isomerase [Chlamydiota bacterium]
MNITSTTNPLGFTYGKNCFGPKPEIRKLDDIRQSLSNPNCDGPENVYAIVMDIGCKEDFNDLVARHLLYGAVTYAAGRLGDEPVRSQGHIHKISSFSGWSTPEIYEIWQGKAIILMQEFAEDNPGKCFAVEAGPGDVVIVPPYWAHATISADPTQPLTFGAWCDRDYGFVYDGVRKHKGLAWFPKLDKKGNIYWETNKNYESSKLIQKSPEDYKNLGLEKGISIYEQYKKENSRFDFVPNPILKKEVWENFVP